MLLTCLLISHSGVYFMAFTGPVLLTSCARHLLANVIVMPPFIIEESRLLLPVGEESLSAANPARVVITVTDINDSPPTFTQSAYQVMRIILTYGIMIHYLS